MKSTWTPPQLAERWRVNPDKVLHFIATGELEAINVAASPTGRPRWRITEEAILAFEQSRSSKPPAKVSRPTRLPVVGSYV